jgi:hypothetical protein
MSDQSMQPEENRAGSSDHSQHRTPEGEGSDSTMSEKESGPAEVSVYDGMGNEKVMVTTDGDDGRAIQGTGDTAEEAVKDAKSEGGPLGPAVGH